MKRHILAVSLAASLALPLTVTSVGAKENMNLVKAISVIDEFRSPGLEAEISGVYPHPIDPDLYIALVNRKPPYRYGQEAKIDKSHLGHLIVVNRNGEVLKSFDLADDDFGGLAHANGKFYAALTNDASLIEFDLETGKVERTIPLPSPAGGLAYDSDRNALIAQLYVGHPNLAVVDIETGTVTDSLWSDESAMGLAKVDGDWLCTWASGWDPGSFSELRVLDQTNGHIRSRIRLDEIHSSLAPATDENGAPAFMSLVTTDSHSGETVVRRYSYEGEATW